MDKTCEYTQHEYNIASTSCGESTVLFDLWRFCPWCGKKILANKYFFEDDIKRFDQENQNDRA